MACPISCDPHRLPAICFPSSPFLFISRLSDALLLFSRLKFFLDGGSATFLAFGEVYNSTSVWIISQIAN